MNPGTKSINNFIYHQHPEEEEEYDYENASVSPPIKR